MIEVFQILFLIDPGTHGRNVKPKKGTANGTKGGQNVDIRDCIHDDRF